MLRPHEAESSLERSVSLGDSHYFHIDYGGAEYSLKFSLYFDKTGFFRNFVHRPSLPCIYLFATRLPAVPAVNLATEEGVGVPDSNLAAEGFRCELSDS